MWFRGDPLPHELQNVRFAGLEFGLGERAAKELVDQPNPIGVHDSGFAVRGHLANAALLHVASYLPAIHSVRLTHKPESAAEFIQADLSARSRPGSAGNACL